MPNLDFRLTKKQLVTLNWFVTICFVISLVMGAFAFGCYSLITAFVEEIAKDSSIDNGIGAVLVLVPVIWIGILGGIFGANLLVLSLVLFLTKGFLGFWGGYLVNALWILASIALIFADSLAKTSTFGIFAVPIFVVAIVTTTVLAVIHILGMS